MAIRIGISGFGRIGRNLVRIGYKDPELRFVAATDIADIESLAYLLRCSTIEGRLPDPVRVEGNHIVVGPQRIRYIRESTPGSVPWDVLGVDVVMECTGRFRRRAELERHLRAGAPRVLLSTPALDPIDRTVINGVNDHELRADDRIVSNGSSSSHALGLGLRVLLEGPGVEWATMTTVHAVTGDQQLSDTAQPGPRWSRSAAKNIIPNPSWAPEAVAALLPELEDRLEGFALNVPVLAGSCLDLVVRLRSPAGADGVRRLFREAAAGPYRGLIEYTEDPIVSSDVRGSLASAVFDAAAAMSIGEDLVKILLWYDNGWAYAARMLETAKRWVGLGAREG
ncbi:type I glyceraldehyde-3-phosphate dehydrogenase [Deferrisoma palaeochoriense]